MVGTAIGIKSSGAVKLSERGEELQNGVLQHFAEYLKKYFGDAYIILCGTK